MTVQQAHKFWEPGGQVPVEVRQWWVDAGLPTIGADDHTVEPLIYVRLTTNPDVFGNVPLRFLDERVEWNVPGDKCPAVIISHYWKGTDICVKRSPHVCMVVLAEVKTEQGVMNDPGFPPSPFGPVEMRDEVLDNFIQPVTYTSMVVV